MHQVLAPVLQKPRYAELVEQELVSWFNDVLFTPLIDQLKAASVRTVKADQAVKFDEYGKRKVRPAERPGERTNAAEWMRFPAKLHSLGLDRRELPQIASEHRGALVRFLQARGIDSCERTILPDELKPTQDGYWPEKVRAAAAHRGADRAILVSDDGYILDGHHQWYASFIVHPDQPIRVIRFDAGIGVLLPAAREFPSAERANIAPSIIEDALLSGRIWYADGAFGTDQGFGSEISRELRGIGAAYDPDSKLFLIAPTSLPFAVRGMISQAQDSAAAVHREIMGTLDAALPNIAEAPVGLELSGRVSLILRDLNDQFNRSIKPFEALDAITVAPELQPAVQKAIARDLTNNLELSIKHFSAEQIPELRRMVEQNLRSGARLDRLSKMIEAQYGVAKRKATFLAQQETGLLTAKFRMERAKAAGSVQYVWHTRGDSRVRHDHAELNGRTFFWDNPPIVDKPSARRANPGEDYGCRCFPEIIVNLPKLQEAA